MPKIDAPEKLFFSLLGKTMTDDELVDIFPVAKAELDGHDRENRILKIELNDTNRPDLWSPAELQELSEPMRQAKSRTMTSSRRRTRRRTVKGA